MPPPEYGPQAAPPTASATTTTADSVLCMFASLAGRERTPAARPPDRSTAVDGAASRPSALPVNGKGGGVRSWTPPASGGLPLRLGLSQVEQLVVEVPVDQARPGEQLHHGQRGAQRRGDAVQAREEAGDVDADLGAEDEEGGRVVAAAHQLLHQ